MPQEISTVPAKADIPVVILCGGMGTRIREASEKLPKPLIDIGGKPILWHIMKTYGAHGFRRFVLCLGYKGDEIREFFLDYGQFDARLHGEARRRRRPRRLARQPPDRGLGGHPGRDRPARPAPADGSSASRSTSTSRTYLMTYGDGIGNVDIDAPLPRSTSRAARSAP